MGFERSFFEPETPTLKGFDKPAIDAVAPARADKVPERKRGNFLFKMLDQVNRPQYAVTNMVYNMAERNAEAGNAFRSNVASGDIGSAIDALMDTPKVIMPSDIKAAWDGFTLKDKNGVGDILVKNYGTPKTKTGKAILFAAGLAGDIVLDPLTYTGVGIAGKAGKLLKKGSTLERIAKAGRAAGKAKETKAILTIGKKAVPGTEKIVDPIARAVGKSWVFTRESVPGISEILNQVTKVSTKMRPKGVDPVKWQKFLIASSKAKNVEASIKFKGLQKAKEIAKTIEAEGLTPDDVSGIIKNIETKAPVVSKAGEQAKAIGEELTAKYAKVGPTGKKVIEEEGYQYMPHLLEKGGKKKAAQLGFGARQYTTKTVSDLKRTVLKYSDGVDDYIVSTKTGKVFKDGKHVDDFAKEYLGELSSAGKLKQATIADINKGVGETMFSQKLPKLVYVQSARTAKVVGGDEMFKGVRGIGESNPKVLKDGTQFVQSAAPELSGKYYHPEIAKHLDETYKKLTNVEEINDIVKVYDKVQNSWKATATFWNPAFHTRNSISNVFQNSLAGVNNIVDYVKATKIQMKSRLPKIFGELDSADAKILKEFNSQGLVKTGWLSGDIGKSIDDELMGVFDHVKQQQRLVGKVVETAKTPVRALNKAGGNVGQSIENNAKLAHFIAKRKEGLSAFDAGESVKKYLFDYEDLTKIEKEGLKRVVPFYTWTRKNIPLQLEHLATNPAAQNKIIKIKNNIEVLVGDDKTNALLPQWLKDSAPVYLGKKDGTYRYVKMEGFMPIADINKLSDGAKEMLNVLSPIIKAPAEQALNHNFFFGSEITRQRGIKGFTGVGEKDYLWFRLPGRLEHLARLFRPISEIDKIVGLRYKDKSMQEKITNVLVGGKIYEYDLKYLLNKFNKLNVQDVNAIKGQISYLRKEAGRVPERKEYNFKEIRMLRESLIKAKKEAISAKRKAIESIR